jgi:hypothetical protein
VSDVAEIAAGTDPTSADTDGDGTADGKDLTPGIMVPGTLVIGPDAGQVVLWNPDPDAGTKVVVGNGPFPRTVGSPIVIQ